MPMEQDRFTSSLLACCALFVEGDESPPLDSPARFTIADLARIRDKILMHISELVLALCKLALRKLVRHLRNAG